jgi:hypothetical protein
MFFPAMMKQGSASYVAATGQTQQVFLGRWLILTAAMFTGSAFLYAIRLVLAHRRLSGVDNRAVQATGQLLQVVSVFAFPGCASAGVVSRCDNHGFGPDRTGAPHVAL